MKTEVKIFWGLYLGHNVGRGGLRGLSPCPGGGNSKDPPTNLPLIIER